MSTNPRRQKNLKRIIVKFIILLGILGLALYVFNVLFFFKKPLFISPMGKTGPSSSMVEQILKEGNIPFSAITLSNDYYVINVSSSGQIILSKNKDLNQQIASLQRILRELTIEGKSFKSIDFRFLEPIISF
jgi:hypothetical protein